MVAVNCCHNIRRARLLLPQMCLKPVNPGAQFGFVFNTSRRLCRDGCRGDGQALAPGAGSSLLAAEHCIKGIEGGAKGERDLLKTVRGKALRIGNGAA